MFYVTFQFVKVYMKEFFFLLSSKRAAMRKADFASFNPVKVLFTIVSAAKDSNLPLHGVSILRLAKLIDLVAQL